MKSQEICPCLFTRWRHSTLDSLISAGTRTIFKKNFVRLKKTFLRDVEEADAKWSWSLEAAQTVASKEQNPEQQFGTQVSNNTNGNSWSDVVRPGCFSLFFLSNCGSVKPACGPYDTRHLLAEPLLVEEEVSSTKNVSFLSFLLLMLQRGIMSQLGWFLECLFAALLMIAGLLVTDWQPWARLHLTGLNLTTSSCSSPSASSRIHPPPPQHLIYTLTCWITQVLFSRTSTRTGTRTRTGTS